MVDIDEEANRRGLVRSTPALQQEHRKEAASPKPAPSTLWTSPLTLAALVAQVSPAKPLVPSVARPPSGGGSGCEHAHSPQPAAAPMCAPQFPHGRGTIAPPGPVLARGHADAIAVAGSARGRGLQVATEQAGVANASGKKAGNPKASKKGNPTAVKSQKVPKPL